MTNDLIKTVWLLDVLAAPLVGLHLVPTAIAPDHLSPSEGSALSLQQPTSLVQPLGVAPLFERTLIVSGQQSDWAIRNLCDEPTWQLGEFWIPQEQLDKLKRLHHAGISFDTLFIAHEIPKGSVKPGEPIPLELITPPSPPRAVKTAHLLGQISEAALSLVTLPVRAAAPLSLFIGAALTGVGDAIKYDPILFGAKLLRPEARVQPGEPALWYYLCHWSW